MTMLVEIEDETADRLTRDVLVWHYDNGTLETKKERKAMELIIKVFSSPSEWERFKEGRDL